MQLQKQSKRNFKNLFFFFYIDTGMISYGGDMVTCAVALINLMKSAGTVSRFLESKDENTAIVCSFPDT